MDKAYFFKESYVFIQLGADCFLFTFWSDSGAILRQLGSASLRTLK